MTGTLFVVATPIGNLEDLSPRAKRVLGEVDLIAAEDTRRTAKLLTHFGIHRPVVSLHAHNESRETPRLIRRLVDGGSIALVSDAGTPGIADPGMHLVQEARRQGITVSPIPGPSAVMAALSTAGLPADQFLFLGFPPRSGQARTRWFKRAAESDVTVVLFEAPHRIHRTLAELKSLVDRHIVVHRELTKLHEESVIYTITGDRPDTKALGEFVIVVSGQEKADGPTAADSDLAVKIFCCLTDSGAFSTDEAERISVAATGLDGPALRKAVKKHRIALRQAGNGHLP